MASKRNGTLYTGVTSNLIKRVYEHKNGSFKSFTKEYEVKNLVYYEPHENAENAIKREKNIKAWQREWKLRIIEEINPQWKDLYEELTK